MQPEDLVDQLSIEMSLMAETLNEIDALVDDVGERQPTPREQAATAHFLEDLYMGLENILLRLCKELGAALPSGSDWHSALFAMFCTPAHEPLPQLFDDASRSDVSRYRRFRHLSTHGYGVTLDWERTAPLARNARPVFTRFFASVQAYIDSLPPQAENQ